MAKVVSLLIVYKHWGGGSGYEGGLSRNSEKVLLLLYQQLETWPLVCHVKVRSETPVILH
jgi:hypothetical protein